MPSNMANIATPAPIPAFTAVLIEEPPEFIDDVELVAEAENESVAALETNESDLIADEEIEDRVITVSVVVAALVAMTDSTTFSRPTVAASVNKLALILQQLFFPQHHFPSPQL